MQEMQNIVINRCHGGYALSAKAEKWLLEHNSNVIAEQEDACTDGQLWRVRSDKLLVQCIKELGAEANGPCADLEIVSIPADIDWQIVEYDGWEHIAERHRTWP